MAGNALPIYSKVGDIQWAPAIITAANTAADGTGTTNIIFTADAINGGRVERIRIIPLGTNILSVARFFINNGSTNTTAANNALTWESTLPATTVTQVAAQGPIEIVTTVILPPGFRLLCVLGTAIATGINPVALGGKYQELV